MAAAETAPAAASPATSVATAEPVRGAPPIRAFRTA